MTARLRATRSLGGIAGRRGFPNILPFLSLLTLLTAFAVPAFAVGTLLDSGTKTGEKPQSKIFHHDGAWWAVVDGSDGLAFYEQNGSSWDRAQFLDAVITSGGHADVKWNGSHLFVLVYASSPKLYKYTYDSSLRAFNLMSGFPVNVPRPGGSETMVLEQDSTGRLWTTAEGGNNINVYYTTTSDHQTWSGPIVLQGGVGSDDISTIIAFGGNKIGVFWSDQNRDEFGFRVHRDSDAPGTWASKEIADSGNGHADDHINGAFDSQGRVYFVTKDDRDEMAVHRRSSNGNWITDANILGVDGTRGILMLDEDSNKLYMLYTRWGVSPHRIEVLESDMDNLNFRSRSTYISAGSNMNNVTGTKQILPKGTMVAIAHASGSMFWNTDGSLPAGSGPGAPQGLVASLSGSPLQVDLSWNAPSSGSPIGYNVYRQVGSGSFQKLNASILGTRSYTDTAPADDVLCYRVTAVDGSEGAPSNVDCVDNTPAPPPGQPLNLTSEALAGNAAGALSLPMNEGIDQVAGDLSGNGNDARLGSTTLADSGDPTWITGVDGNALRFDGIDDYLYVADHGSLDMLGGFTLEAWIRQDAPVTGSVVNKGVSGDTTYRILVNASGGIEFRWEDANGTRFETITPAAITIGTWHHVACVYDDAANENRVYVDGVQVASGAAFGVPVANSYQLHVGTRLSSTLKDFFEGAIDDLRITPGALYTSNFVPQTGAGDGSPTLVRLQWQEPVSGGQAAGYDIFRSVNNGGFTKLNTGAVTSTSFIDANLQFGNLCYYAVALNARSESGAPSSTTCESIAPSGPPVPAAPTGLAVILAGSTPENALLSWDAPASGATATGYFVYRAVEDNPYELLNTVPVTTTSFTDTALLSGTHCYQVSAVDIDARESELSSAQCISYQPPPPPLPAGPTNLTAALSTQPGSVSIGAGAWSLDELSGQTAADATGNGHTGRLGSTTGADANDPIWAPGFNGNSLFFDGSNDYVEIADSPELRFAGSFTIEAWIKRASSGTAQVVLAKGDSDQRNFWMRIGSSGTLDFRWETANGSNRGSKTNASLSVGNWHHVACVYDAQSSESRLYIDGIVDEIQSETGTPTTSTDPLHIGTRLSGGSRKDYFHGNIDLVRVSPGALYNANFTPPTQYASEGQTVTALDWTASPSTTVVGYNIYRSVAQSPLLLMNTNPVTGTNWTDTMTLNDSLCYEVRAVDFATQLSPPSNSACVYIAGPPPAAPSEPLSLTASKLGTIPESMQLQWLAPATGSPVGYHIERRLDTGAWLRLTTTPHAALQYTDNGAPLGDLCYRVLAEDAFQQESLASIEACDTIAPPPAPPAPSAPDTLLTAFLGTDPETVSLTWPASTTGLPAVGYNVYRQVNGGTMELRADSIGTTTWLDSLLIAGDLCYQVTAFDSLGREGAATSSSCLTFAPPLGPPPSEPLNVTAILMASAPAKATSTLVAASDSTAMGAWGFDEGSGDDIADSSGNGHDGYLGNSIGNDVKDPTWTTGLDGMALQFDGTQNATIDDAPGLRHPGSFTIEAWIYRTSGSGSQVVLSKGDSDQRNYWLRLNSSGSIDFRWETANGSNHGSSSSGSVPLNEWHHVACVYDMGVGENRIYIDGVLDDISTDSGTPTTSADPVLIGTRLSGGIKKDYFVGSIDLVRVSDMARYTTDFTPETSFGPPSPPPLQQMVQLNWETPAQGTPAGYQVYRSIDGAPQQLLTSSLVTDMTWNDMSPVIGLLSYNVSAVDAYGQEGPQSTDSTSVQVDDGTPPPPPAPGTPQQLAAFLEQLPGGSAGTAAFPLDNNGGQAVNDASTNNNDGTLGASNGLENTDPLWTTGVTGSALLFDGANDYVTIPDAPQLRMTGSFTIEAWVYRATSGKSMIVLSKGDSDERNYWLRIGTTGSIDFRWETAGGSNHGTKSSATMQVGQWQHVACVYDQAAGSNRIYLDGVLLEDDNDSGTPVTSSAPLYLGTRLSSGRLKEYHNGMIDLVRISSGAIYTDNFTPPTGFGSGTPVTVAQLSWEAPTKGVATSYNVYRSVASGPWELLNTDPVTQLSFTDAAPMLGENCYQVSAVDAFDQEGNTSSSMCVTHVVTKVAALQPTQQDLWDGPRFGIHPNPFNPQTRIEFRLPDAREVRLQLFDVRGRHVATLARGVRAAGHHIVRWDGREDRGTRAGTGTYFLVLQAGDIHETRKLILVK